MSVVATLTHRHWNGIAICKEVDAWHHEPGLVANWWISGGVVGHYEHMRLYANHHVVMERYQKTELSRELHNKTIDRLVALAHAVDWHVHPKFFDCPNVRDELHSGASFHGDGPRPPTEAEKEEIERLLQDVRANGWNWSR